MKFNSALNSSRMTEAFKTVGTRFRDTITVDNNKSSKFKKNKTVQISPKQKVRNEKVSEIMSSVKQQESNIRYRNFKIDKQVFAERLKQDYMSDVLKELDHLKDQKIQFLDHHFKQVKTKWKNDSEIEMQSKLEYEQNRMSRYMYNMISKDREKKNLEMTKNIKMLKAKH